MSSKSPRIAALLEGHRGQILDAHYLAFFDCFNRREYYEAHDVLEALWLKDRHGADGDFFKGLIQLAGAFVHLQRHLSSASRMPLHRLRPAAALFRLSQANLLKYPAHHWQLDVAATRALIDDWLRRLEKGGFEVNPYNESQAPGLHLSL